jgi:mannose-1-phosphate guanylyltransferase/mannose-1-phosphate guanylyltransferase/mannose-6-phosphate isomerase
VILSGGGGTRLWPLSTPEKPKQFLALTGEATMFEMTLARAMDREFFTAPIVVANAAHSALVAVQLAEVAITDAAIIYEPCARNTAPAIALAALAVDDVKTPLLVMPSDHLIANVAAFHAAIMAALPMVEQGWLVTFGIEPTAPETGYGYIRIGEELGAGVNRVERFVEKPDAATAQAMIDSGDHAWNGGIFLFRADIYLGALASFATDILAAAQKAMAKSLHDEDAIHPDADAFASSPADSIDYAVMEKADRVAVAPVNMGWSDVGSWDSLYDIGSKALSENVFTGNVRSSDASGNLILADGIRVSVHGIDNLIIVANGREVIILPRGQSQRVRDFAGD